MAELLPTLSNFTPIVVGFLQFTSEYCDLRLPSFLPHTLKSQKNTAHINTFSLLFLRGRIYNSHLVESGSKMDLR